MLLFLQFCQFFSSAKDTHLCSHGCLQNLKNPVFYRVIKPPEWQIFGPVCVYENSCKRFNRVWISTYCPSQCTHTNPSLTQQFPHLLMGLFLTFHCFSKAMGTQEENITITQRAA